MRLVLACGNPLRGDDAVGWRIAEALTGQAETEVVRVQQLLPELSTAIAKAEGVLFLDAAVGGPPGRIAVNAVGADSTGTEMGHVLTPARLLEVVRAVYGETPPARLLTVDGFDFGFRTSLSGPVAAAMPEATRQARVALRELADADAVRERS